MKKVQLSENALEVAKNRYFFQDEDWEKCVSRVANQISLPESNDRQKISDTFADMIYNMDFLPGGRILRNCGRPRGSLFNCYHLPVGDSIEEIGQFIKDSLILWSEGGGVGCNFTPLRPRGDSILGKGGKSSGLVSFIEAADAVARTIESGGARRAAAIAHVDITHPEVMDFIDAKIVDGRISSFNISVAVNEDFLMAVEADDKWTFKFKQKEYGSVRARDLWEKIVTNMIQCAEPGLINWTNFQKNNSYYFEPVLGTNPCLTGDMLVVVADGRGEVPIKQLAEESKDVPVYSLNESTHDLEVKMMRRPRVSGYNKKILKITLEDGSYIRCTENHKFTMNDGTVKQANELIVNDRMHHMIKEKDPNGHYRFKNDIRRQKTEHKLIYEFHNNTSIKKGEVIHHKDENKLNNNPLNLQLLESHSKHISIHNKLNIRKGFKNGRWMGWTFEMIDEELRNLIRKKNGPVGVNEWKLYCKKKNIPYWASEVFKQNFKSIDLYIKSVLSEFDFDYSPAMMRSYKRFLKLQNETDFILVFEKEYGGMKVIKNCEYCNKEFLTTWELRERAFCSRKCCNKSVSHRNKQKEFNNKQDKFRRTKIVEFYKDLSDDLNRAPFSYELQKRCKENEIPYTLYGKHPKPNEYSFSSFKEIKEVASIDLNYKIIKIEEDGYENVYNGTVDDNHNFYIMVNSEKGKKFNYINNLQCGETTLGPYGVCDLGSLVLPNFITGNINTNWIKLQTTIKTAVRFLDNVIEVNKYTLKDIDINAHKSRRIGIGVIGLAEYLFAKKVVYGNERAVAETERIMRFIRDSVYQASVELAIEKGSFPMFDPIAYGKASFVRKLPASLRMDIKKYGIRNCTSMALAPTGTISLLTDYSSAIEPLFAKAMKRKDRVSKRIYIHPMYQEMIEKGEEIPEWFVDAYDLEPKDHFEMQVACQRYCDASVSKTINLPKETTDEDLSNLLLEYIHDLKGVTVYRDGSKDGQILNKMTDEEARKYILNDTGTKVESNMEPEDVTCTNGSCEI